MTTEWVAAAGAERLTLAASGTAEKPGPSVGELTFTITNPGPVEDRAVFEIVPGDGAKKPWFTVDEPQRLVPAGQSVTFLIKVSVPAGEPAGPFWVQGRVYSADTAPEESSRVSGRVTGEIAPTKIKKSKPWWLLAVAALVVVVLGVVGWLILRRPAETAVPPLTGLTQAQAQGKLAESGLSLGQVRSRNQAGGQRTVIEQSIAVGVLAEPGRTIDVVVAVQLTAPVLTSPPDHQEFAPDAATPGLEWEAVPDAAGYNVRREREICDLDIDSSCFYQLLTNINVAGGASWSPREENPPPVGGHGHPTGRVRWQVAALDDFKDAGPSSEVYEYWIRTE